MPQRPEFVRDLLLFDRMGLALFTARAGFAIQCRSQFRNTRRRRPRLRSQLFNLRVERGLGRLELAARLRQVIACRGQLTLTLLQAVQKVLLALRKLAIQGCCALLCLRSQLPLFGSDAFHLFHIRSVLLLQLVVEMDAFSELGVDFVQLGGIAVELFLVPLYLRAEVVLALAAALRKLLAQRILASQLLRQLRTGPFKLGDAVLQLLAQALCL